MPSTPGGTIIQTGDFKIDYTPLACGVDLSNAGKSARRAGLLTKFTAMAASARRAARAFHRKSHGRIERHWHKGFLRNRQRCTKITLTGKFYTVHPTEADANICSLPAV